MSVPRARVLDLMKAQCQVFATVYNPKGLRLGNKVLRQRLRGPALASYYPTARITLKELNNAFGPNIETYDVEEQERLEHIEEVHDRGKRAPKKKTAPPAHPKRKK
ncbi:related to RSM27 Mitochondrial ribosomal protein, small subunit [Cephalotrichum gorgonifer]|uniref:Small ribosomal subunit protein mS33 n=1 Tax=Cephalotrichum gorgonifer TaxID=2041049 RepID=A0AAE8N535_9PEZI|nr:related to RSM27 Mitochondrial ribosomal protein, small subunit [Cephalotrichum gorgonifer]